MSTEELSGRWRSWASNRTNPRADLARRIADDIDNREAAALWSTVDIRREFEVAQVASSSRSWLELIESVLYLAPIFFTWLHLRSAVEAYRGFNLGGKNSIDFLQFWAGTNDLYKGTTLVETALWVLGAIALIVLVKLFASWADQSHSTVEDDPVLSNLILDTQLELARSRSVTPREMADALTTAARQLENALSSSGDTLTTLQETSNSVTQAVSNLIDATASLSTVTSDLKSVVIPLRDTPIALDKIVAGLSEIESQTNATVSNLSAVAGQTLNLSTKNGEIVEQTRLLADSISKTTAASDTILRMAESISRTVGGITSDIDDHQPHIVAVKSAAELFKNATDQLQALFDEFQKSSEAYRLLVEEDRRRGSK